EFISVDKNNGQFHLEFETVRFSGSAEIQERDKPKPAILDARYELTDNVITLHGEGVNDGPRMAVDCGPTHVVNEMTLVGTILTCDAVFLEKAIWVTSSDKGTSFYNGYLPWISFQKQLR